MHGYECACNVLANGITHARKFVRAIENTIENCLSPAHTDHYALGKKKPPLPQHF